MRYLPLPYQLVSRIFSIDSCVVSGEFRQQPDLPDYKVVKDPILPGVAGADEEQHRA